MRSKRLHAFLLWNALYLIANLAPTRGHGGHEDETKAQPNSRRLLIISLDGFRHDFLDLQVVPNLQNLAKQGIRADGMQSVYITKTFPNHYTIASGLYEESHGIIANKMWDPTSNKTFDHCSDSACGRWYGGDPIWQANEKAAQTGDKVRASGLIHWPGTGAHINNFTATYEEPYPSNQPHKSCTDLPKFKTSIDKMLELFMNKIKPLNLGMIYHQDPDCTCHKFGPDSNETHQVLKSLDDDIGYLLSKLDEHGLNINIIILSDHGFATVNNSVSLLEDCNVDVDQLKHHLSNSPVISLWPKNQAQLKEIKTKLQNCSHNHPINVYENNSAVLKTNHYSNNIRVAPLIVTTYHVDNRSAPLLKLKRENWTEAGDHGWNNSWLAMHAFFIAKGPIFKKGYVKDTFSNVHVFSLFCSILNIKPCPSNNGSLSAVSDMLVKLDDDDPPMSTQTLGTIILLALFCALVSGIMSIGACRLSAHSRFTKTNPLLPQRHERSGLLPNGTHPELSDDEF